MASPPATGGHLLSNGTNSVKKCGYLRKQKHGHRRFFVLREASDCCPARLEYYESEKKWRNKSAAKRVITLDSCLCVNKRADAKHKHLIALYTKDEYFAVAADNEQDQEGWYVVLTDLIAEGKVYDSPASTSSLVGFEEASYGLVTPATAAYKEVWQVNLKSKGLGQIKNLTGVYRLCLSSRTISFVKLNSEVAAVSLQLMNIRRCGHSDSFFFIEVGRSAVTGPGEFWMQAEDPVVAQNIHETILDAMRAMKELSEFRPRSKSQSASTNPISVPTRRNLNNLPPSQTGLARRSRTDSVAAATSPARKFASCRVRTASEGDGSMTRPASASVSASGSPTGPNSGRHLVRSHTLSSSGRTCRMLESASNLQHSRSMPVSNSPPAASSPLGASPRGGGYICTTPDKTRRAFSCSASISGSLGDAGFMLCDEYGCSPGEPRFLSLTRSDTPDSLSSTPPSRDASDPCGYMMMMDGGSGRPGAGGEDPAYRKRTYSLTTPRQQRVVAPLSSASLDEYTLMRMARGQSSHSASPKVSYPEDYGDVEIGSSRSSCGNLADDGGGYVPMTPGAASQSGKSDDYVPMSAMCVSAPKQIVNPRVHPQAAAGGGYKTNSPCRDSLEDSGYMRMWCGSKSSVESPDCRLANGDYMNMSPGNQPSLQTPPDYYLGPLASESHPAKLQTSKSEDNNNQYVLMSPQSQKPRAGESDYYSVMQPGAPAVPSAPSPVRHGRAESLPYRGRLGRPNRLSLDTLRTLPSMNEHPLPGEPRSPGEYIDIDFGGGGKFSPPSTASTESRSSSLGSSGGGRRRSPLSDYMNLELGSRSPKGAGAPAERLDALPERSVCHPRSEDGAYHLGGERGSRGLADEVKNDYTEMTFGMASSPPQLVPQITASSLASLVLTQYENQSQQQGEETLFGGPGSPGGHRGLPPRGRLFLLLLLLVNGGPRRLCEGDPGQPAGPPAPQLRDLLLHRHRDARLPLVRPRRRGEAAQLGGERLVPEQRGLRRGVRQPRDPAHHHHLLCRRRLPERTELHRLEPAGRQGRGEVRGPGRFQTRQQLQRGHQWITRHAVRLSGIQGGCDYCQRLRESSVSDLASAPTCCWKNQLFPLPLGSLAPRTVWTPQPHTHTHTHTHTHIHTHTHTHTNYACDKFAEGRTGLFVCVCVSLFPARPFHL